MKHEDVLYIKIAKFQSKYKLAYDYSIRSLIRDLGIKQTAYKGDNLKDMYEISEDGFSAVKNGKFYIFYNPYKPPTRQSFTLAHELGHLTLSHHKQLNRIILASGGNTLVERQANIFARNILMPVDRTIEYVGLKTNEELAEIFEVSEAMVYTRLKYLGYDNYCLSKVKI